MKFVPQLESGDIVGNRYRIMHVIGVGGMSRVYLAEDLKLSGKKWALKESIVRHKTGIQMEEEAALLIKLSHPRLPRIVDFLLSSENDYCYLVMDYIAGIHLDQYVKALDRPLSLKQLIDIGMKVCEGLHYLHSQEPPIIHRDIKPSNLLIDSEGEVRFIDFGIARSYKQEQVEDTVKLGTVGFASPEQYGGMQSDGRSDLYSLGAVLLFLGTNCRYSELTEEAKEILYKRGYSELLPVITALMRQNPNERYKSADELMKILQHMKQKQDVPNKTLTVESSTSKSNVIAVSGVASGVGVTHTAIAISHVLASHGYRVAIVELVQESTSFERIFSIVEDYVYPEQSKSSYMNINHVYYAKKPSRAEYMRLLTENYDYVVCDLGRSQSTYLQEEFMRADLAILVAPAAEWRREDILSFVGSSPPMLKREWHCVVPLATSVITGQIERELSHTVHALPLCEDPFDPANSMKEAVSSLREHWLMPRRKRHTSITAWLHRRKGKGKDE